MRIVGGEYRGRVLASLKGSATRPTSDRAREAIFNILHHGNRGRRPLPEDALVMDVFAGTGAMGLEALSRGAKHAVFVEREQAALKICQENIDALGAGEKSALLRFDAQKATPRPLYMEPRTLIFLDPPYGRDMGVKSLHSLAEKEWLAPHAVCVFEMSRKHPEGVPDGFRLLDERTYGIALVKFLEWTP